MPLSRGGSASGSKQTNTELLTQKKRRKKLTKTEITFDAKDRL
jgi:hypothetical protein